MTEHNEDSEIPRSDILERDGKFVMTTAEVELSETSFVLCRAWQEGLDVEIELWEIGGKNLQTVDSPSGPFGREELAMVLPAGRYRVDVTSRKPPGEDTRVSVEGPEVRPAGEPEECWAQAAAWVLEGRAEVKANEFLKALDPLEKGRELAEQEGLVYWQAYAVEQLATAFLRAGDSAKALTHFEKTALRFRLLPGEERRQAVGSLNAAILLLGTGQPDEAIQHLETAWPTFERQSFHRAMVLTLMRLGPAYLAKGRFQAALDHLHRAALHLEQIDPRGLDVKLKLEIGWSLLAVARPQEAFDSFREAIRLAEGNDEEGLLIARSGLAHTALQLGKLDQAAEAIDGALSMDPSGPFRIGLLLARGNLLRQQGSEQKAKGDLETARALAQNLDDPKFLADVLLSQGYMEIQSGRAQVALEMLEQAQKLYDELGHLSGSASSRARLAEALKALDRPEEAWTAIESALQKVETLRDSSSRRDHRLGFWSSFRQDYFVMARDIALELGDLHRAFQVDEARRARELLDSLRYKGRSTLELQRLGDREQELERELRVLVAAGGEAASAAALRPKMDELNRLAAERERRRAKGPWQDLDIAALHRELDSSTILLVYSLSDTTQSLVWTVTEEKLEVFPLSPALSIRQEIFGFQKSILNFSQRGRQLSASRAKALSEMLLAPVPNLGDFHRWVIVGELELQQLPFAALPAPGSAAPAVENHELVYFPSVSALMELRSQNRVRSTQPRIAAFVDPVFSTNDDRLLETKIGSREDSEGGDHGRKKALLPRGVVLDRLPKSADEGRYLVSLQPDEEALLLSGFAANRTAFEQLDSNQFDILHFATHALPHDRPEMSALVFSMVGPEGETLDGLVTAVEISRRYMPLDLVVLSACETALGQSINGEGTLSLAWSFLNAGSARVMSSLWQVDDRLTAELMKTFYKEQLENGRTPAEALRQAQLEMKAKPEATIYSWAGFILQGDWH